MSKFAPPLTAQMFVLICIFIFISGDPVTHTLLRYSQHTPAEWHGLVIWSSKIESSFHAALQSTFQIKRLFFIVTNQITEHTELMRWD